MGSFRWHLAVNVLGLIGILLFANGFFLTRVELKDQGLCAKSGSSEGICNVPAKYDRIVVVVIDALRVDFVAPETLSAMHEGDDPDAFYLNKLTVLRNLLAQRPKNTYLARLDADPPTTTMQRLKGIVTGGLPTFIDIKDDVASEKITEDNILAQLKTMGKRVTFMGDDTWVKLFPDSLNKQFPYDSFNVKDLDTLDEGVIKHLFPELAKTDWDILVAHFLGVDHAGHRYGPRHPEMKRKLLQMDEVLSRLIAEMDKAQDRQLLVVMGDHGMTEDGNHGGATDEERSAALFAYSPKVELYNKLAQEKGDIREGFPVIQQIDLAPTLALLLDVPIPYGNLGFLVPELVCNQDDMKQLVKAAHENVKQITRYLRSYAQETRSSATLLALANDLDSRIAQILGQSSLDEITLFKQLRQVGRTAAEKARSLWTIFDTPLMVSGMALIVGSIFLQFLDGLRYALNYVSLKTIRHIPIPWGLSLAWISSLLALTSNSYILAEPQVLVFFLASALVVDGSGNRSLKAILEQVLALVTFRTAFFLGDFMKTNGHEVRGLFWWLINSGLPLFVLLGKLCFAQKAPSVLLKSIVALQAIACVCFWFMSGMKLPGNLFAILSYALTPVALVLCRPDVESFVLTLICPLSLILGPGGSLVILLFVAGSGLALNTYRTVSPFWQGVMVAMVSCLWFFGTGHTCVFGSLRITAPYVGFEEFNYWRGAIMLTLDTFSAHLIGVCVSYKLGGLQAVRGFLLVFATRAAVSTFYVFLARRHLMVWAIFAPKFIFDACAFAASFVFACVLYAIGTTVSPQGKLS